MLLCTKGWGEVNEFTNETVVRCVWSWVIDVVQLWHVTCRGRLLADSDSKLWAISKGLIHTTPPFFQWPNYCHCKNQPSTRAPHTDPITSTATASYVYSAQLIISCNYSESHQWVFKDLPQIIMKMAGLIVFCWQDATEGVHVGDIQEDSLRERVTTGQILSWTILHLQNKQSCFIRPHSK